MHRYKHRLAIFWDKLFKQGMPSYFLQVFFQIFGMQQKQGVQLLGPQISDSL